MGYELRAGTADDHEQIYRILSMAFNNDPDDVEREAERLVYEPDRAIVVTSGPAVVGVAGAYTRELAVPGALLPAAHVTMAGVDPVHRRQGLLNRMMRHQLADVRARGEAVAVLWASEGRIYQRYGYGLAARRHSFEIDREVRFREPVAPAGLRAATPTEVVGDLQKVYDQVRVERTGWSSRDGVWWEHLLADLPKHRDGATALRAVLHDGPAGVDGYALCRAKSSWGESGPNGSYVEIAVTDRGLGIDPEHQQRVFERFFRIDQARSRSTGGTGLGLAIVKHVAANHGGEVHLWSKPGTGSTFTLRIPAHPDNPQHLPAIPERMAQLRMTAAQ